MKKIGLVGEDPYDLESIRNLLKTKYGKKIQFIPLLKRITGTQLDTNKFFGLLKSSVKTDNSLDSIIFIRDLDGLLSETAKVKKRDEWYKKCINCIEIESSLLLNVFELEALIFGDIDVFNKKYNCNISSNNNPHSITRPKQALISKTRRNSHRYKESHNPEIFQNLDILKVSKACHKFFELVSSLDSKLK